MVDFAIRWNDFRGGDYGHLDPSRAAKDQFSGRNVKLYRSGLIGPRAGFKQITVNGLPTHPVVDGPMGFDVYGNKLLVVLDDLYEFPMTDPATATGYATYPVSASSPVDFVRGNSVLYSLYDGVLYKHVAYATAPITTPGPLSMVVRWGAFMVGVDENIPWRIWYSKVDASGADFDTWPLNNYYDIGNNEPVTALIPIYNTLYCGKKSGWWSISGVLGNQAFIREDIVGNGPVEHRTSSVTTDNRVVYWPTQQVPAFWNGERVDLDETQRLDPRALPFKGHTCIVTPTARTLILAGEDSSTTGTDWLLWKDNAWTRHFTPFDLGALAPATVTDAADMPDGVIFAMVRNDQVGLAPAVLSFAHDNARPAHNDDDWAAPVDYGDTDLVTGTFTLPAWYDGQGRQVRVRSLVIQFRKWASGVADTFNQMRVTIDALGPYGGGLVTTNPEPWVEACEAASADGTPDSWRASFGEQGWANGFQIRFPALRGVAIQDVVALVDVRTART